MSNNELVEELIALKDRLKELGFGWREYECINEACRRLEDSKFEWHDLVANPSDLPPLDDTYLVKYGQGSDYAYVGYDKRGWSWYETDEPFDKPVLAWTNFDTFGD